MSQIMIRASPRAALSSNIARSDVEKEVTNRGAHRGDSDGGGLSWSLATLTLMSLCILSALPLRSDLPDPTVQVFQHLNWKAEWQLEGGNKSTQKAGCEDELAEIKPDETDTAAW